MLIFFSNIFVVLFNLNRQDEENASDQQIVLDNDTTSIVKHDDDNMDYEVEVDDLHQFHNDRNNTGGDDDGDGSGGEYEEEDDDEDEYDEEAEGEGKDGFEEIPDIQSNLHDNYSENSRLPDATELSVMLFFTWKRHNISKAAANDICRIINMFNIPNMPKDFRTVMAYLKKNNSILLEGNQYFTCPSCGKKCTNGSKCNMTGCQSSDSAVQTPTSVVVFPLVPQICSILERETLITPTDDLDLCDDILNAQRYQEIRTKERQNNPARNYVTLTLNTDGVLLKRISRSLWITCACINELPRNKRYDINNMLICSISTGDEKPKKDEYSTILQDIVNELKFVEQIGFDVLLPSTVKTHSRAYTHFYAFAIAAVCDKPAQALMMNIKDPTGFFSCGWCCIPG